MPNKKSFVISLVCLSFSILFTVLIIILWSFSTNVNCVLPYNSNTINGVNDIINHYYFCEDFARSFSFYPHIKEFRQFTIFLYIVTFTSFVIYGYKKHKVK